MLQRFGEEIWTSSGPTLSIAGFAYPTRMAVIRLAGGGLFVWSPVALSAEVRAAVDRLGPVRHLVAPNTLHHAFLDEWRAAYPDAETHAPPELRAKRPNLRIDADLGDRPAPGWSAEIDQVLVQGNRITTEVIFFHRRSRTILVTDLIQHFERGSFTGWRALVARLDLMTAAAPTVPRKFRMAFRDRNVARTALRRVLDWPAERLLIAHGSPVLENGRTVVARALKWLVPLDEAG